MRTLSLGGLWQLLPVSEFQEDYSFAQRWLEMKVPSHWQEHPTLESYVGKMVYRKEFAFRKKPGSRYWLRLGGIFYWSNVKLNGRHLGSHEGYFIPQEYEVTGLLTDRNTLIVEVDCPDEKQKTKKRMITGVFSHWDAMDKRANPGGIWLPVEILESGSIYTKEALLETRSISSSKAEVKARIILDSSLFQEVRVRITFNPYNFEGQRQVFLQHVHLNSGQNELEALLAITDPQLWWTHDLGQPNLYGVAIEVLTDQEPRSHRWEGLFGIRTFEMRDWIAYLNGKRLFLKGNNYPPGDTRIARMTYEAYQRDLTLAKEAHFNMLRVHAHVEHPAFYRVADETGILLWQDFPLQWLYTKEVMPEALRQVEKMVRLLFNHASIAIWCMHNEPVWVADSSDESLVSILRSYYSTFVYSWNRDVLDAHLKKLVERLDNTRFVVRSAGEWPVRFLRDGTDSHFYFGWYRSSGPLPRFESVRRRMLKALRFVTEFGAQSFPNYEGCLRFMDSDLAKIDWRTLEERHGLQKAIMDKWLGPNSYRSLEELIKKSQDYQILLNQYYIDRLRYHKYRPTGGILAFLFLDPNPAVQWSVVDYWRVPKKSYRALQKAFHPQYSFTLLNTQPYPVGREITMPIYIVNDSQIDYEQVGVTAQVLEPDGASPIRASFSPGLEADSLAKKVGEIKVRFRSPGRRRLLLTLEYGQETFQNEYVLEVNRRGGK